jgi:hypothetical protein
MTSGEPQTLAGTPPQHAGAPVQTWPVGHAPASAKQLCRQTAMSCELYTHCVGSLHDRPPGSRRWDGVASEPLLQPVSNTPIQTLPTISTRQKRFMP